MRATSDIVTALANAKRYTDTIAAARISIIATSTLGMGGQDCLTGCPAPVGGNIGREKSGVIAVIPNTAITTL
jgi:hypothetical protein